MAISIAQATLLRRLIAAERRYFLDGETDIDQRRVEIRRRNEVHTARSLADHNLAEFDGKFATLGSPLWPTPRED